MVFSSEYLAKAWFEIYQHVLSENEKLGNNQMKDDQLSSVATTIFIQAGQKGFLKAAPMDSFNRELFKVTGKVKDRQLQRSIYESVKHMVNGTKEVA